MTNKANSSNIKCLNCHQSFSRTAIGTKHRNHCPHCLFSQHLDKAPGDRKSSCQGIMTPIGLTFKSEGDKTGELMLIHHCQTCGTISKNRIAGDDDPEAIIALFHRTKDSKTPKSLDLKLLTAKDEREIITQLYGKTHAQKYFS